MAGLAPSRQRKGAQVFQGAAPKLDGFGITHINSIQSFVWPAGGRPNDLLRGRVSRFSLDALVNISTALGCRVRVDIEAA